MTQIKIVFPTQSKRKILHEIENETQYKPTDKNSSSR
jgi:hypothetical protein